MSYTSIHSGAIVDTAVNKAHEEDHTLTSHTDTTATGSQLNELIGGESTTLHTHSNITSDQIETPSITSPTTGATGTGLDITVTGSTYRSLYGYNQSDAQIQVSDVSDFVSTVVDTVTGAAVASFDITGLSTLTLYYARIRYQDSAERWSEWSSTVSFTTANIYIDTPVNTSPASLETAIGETPTLASDAFECINGSDTHASSDWEIYSDAGLTTLVWSSYDDTSNKTTATVPAGELSARSTDYWWRCRHTGTTYGDRKSTRLNSSHCELSRMPSSA